MDLNKEKELINLARKYFDRVWLRPNQRHKAASRLFHQKKPWARRFVFSETGIIGADPVTGDRKVGRDGQSKHKH